MAKKYYDHLLLYILFVRVLTKASLSNRDIILANEIIFKFVQNFEIFYGLKNMSSNLHSHLHLPSKCARLGPLNTLNCFCFEGKY